MRSVSLPVIREILFGAPALVDLMEVYASGSVDPDLRFALYDQNITWAGREYIGAGFRTPMRSRQSINDSLGELTVILPDVDRTVAAVLENSDVAGTAVLVRRVMLSRLEENDSIEFYRGKIKAPVVIEGSTVALTLIPQCSDPDDLTIIPGRRWGFDCGWRKFGDPETCGVDVGLYTYEGEAEFGSNLVTVRDPGLDQDAIDLLRTKVGVDATGEDVLSALPASLRFTTGMNQGYSRPVSEISPCVIRLSKPFYSMPEEGDEFQLIRRCPRTADACEGFNNLPRYGGFANSPKRPRNLMRELLQ